MSANNKVVIITGSSSGIGEASAYLFAQNNYNVVVTGSNSAKVDRVMNTFKEKYPNAPEPLAVVADFSDPNNVESIIDNTIEKFGRIDVLVNNAGFIRKMPGYENPNESYDTYRQIMSVNLDSTIKLTLLAVPYLKQSKGNVVNVSSVASIKPSDGAFAYCASKSAMCSFGHCLAVDLAPEVRVNNVLPGPVNTEICTSIGVDKNFMSVVGELTTLAQRSGESSEVAEAIYYLASEKASFITGTDLRIDGGYVIKPTGLSNIVKEKLAKVQSDSR